MNSIAQTFIDNAVINDKEKFVAAIIRLDLDRDVKAGQYRVHPNLKHTELINMLVTGDVVTAKLPIIEGTRFKDVIESINNANNMQHTISDKSMEEIWSEIAPDLDYSYEGMLYPDTYLYEYGNVDIEILRNAHNRLIAYLNKAWEKRQDNLTLKNPYEALILASIIEKETGIMPERELVSSVFHNRLQRGMRLQSDPTVIYGLGDRFDGNLKRIHLAEDTPYNTYVIAGLPPTPIAIASTASIDAALNPYASKYLYFVADNTGGHKFSKTLREHNNAVNKYQRKR